MSVSLPIPNYYMFVKESEVTQENFDVLLSWLDPEREAAGRRYEKIRERLIRLYAGRGCHEAEMLADEVINRVTRKTPEIIKTYVGDPARYFYGVAEKTHLEWLRKQKKINQLPLSVDDAAARDAQEADGEYDCLEKCLGHLPAEQRDLIVDYYREEKSRKILHRQSLAAKLKISLSALQVKTCRIRAKLETCVKNCVAEQN